jgi:hypothetical protein
MQQKRRLTANAYQKPWQPGLMDDIFKVLDERKQEEFVSDKIILQN